MLKNPPSGPYPYPSTPAWRQHYVDALGHVDGANAPDWVLNRAAEVVVNPKELMHTKGGVRLINEDRIVRLPTPEGYLVGIRQPVHPLGVALYSRNDRLARARYSGTKMPDLKVDQSEGVPAAGLRASLPNPAAITEVQGGLAAELVRLDRKRAYNLAEDLKLNGQEEPSIVVGVGYEIPTADGTELLAGFEAVSGNNRTRARLEVFGLSPHWVFTGIPAHMTRVMADQEPGRNALSGDFVADLEAFSARLNAALLAPDADPATAATALDAVNIATVECIVIIGAEHPTRLPHALRELNTRIHVKPPLEFDANAKVLTSGRNVLAAYHRVGELTDHEELILSGYAPVLAARDLPAVADDASAVECEDWAVRRLTQLLMPVPSFCPGLVRSTLLEPSTSRLKTVHTENRQRILAALHANLRNCDVNPRSGTYFATSEIRAGRTPATSTVAEALDAIDALHATFANLRGGRGSDEAVEEAHEAYCAAVADLVVDRLMPLAAVFGLVGPDFGSSQDARRDPGNARSALERDPDLAVKLFRELVAARADGSAPVMAGHSTPVDASASSDGTTVADDVAPADTAVTKEWFDLTFPKIQTPRPKPSSLTGIDDSADPVEVHKAARMALTGMLAAIHAHVTELEPLTRQVKVAAAAAGEVQPFPDEVMSDLIGSYQETLTALRAAGAVIATLALPVDPDDYEDDGTAVGAADADGSDDDDA